jgi:ABC-type multidrug transport system fused ATPase/permease subunit
MIKTFFKCLKIITTKQKKNLILVLFANQIGSFLEVIGLGVIPILAINLINKEGLLIFLKDKELTFLIPYLDIEYFVLLSFITLIFYFILKNIYLLAVNYFQAKLRIDIFNTISSKFFHSYIYSPYKYFLKKNPSYLSSIMVSEIQGACTVLEIFVLLIRDFFTVLIVGVTLIWIDPKISLFLIILISFFTLIFYNLIKKFVRLSGKILQEQRADNLKVINQSFDIIKEAKILKKENFFIKLFNDQLNIMGKQKVINSILNSIPRPFLEIFVLTVITLIVFYSTYFLNNVVTVVPYVSFLAVSSIRLIPAFKGISTSLTSINFNKISLDVVLKEMNEIKNIKKDFIEDQKDTINKISKNFKQITIQDLSFEYNENDEVIKNVNVKIKSGEKVGIIGYSGSGKTTFVNLLLGLLKPKSGKILIDNINIFENIDKWYDLVGYIPQDIYLLNDNIKNNIALGENEENINYELIEKSLQISNSKDFVKKLPSNLDTNVGNRGVSISGGQRQRLGIARAIYSKSKILILDEATNSLDSENEKKIIDSILSIKELTVCIIAHNIKSLKNCDKIIYIEDGKIKKQDTFDNIVNEFKLI